MYVLYFRVNKFLSTSSHKRSKDSMLMNWKGCGALRSWNIWPTIPDLFDGLRKKLRKIQAGELVAVSRFELGTSLNSKQDGQHVTYVLCCL